MNKNSELSHKLWVVSKLRFLVESMDDYHYIILVNGQKITLIKELFIARHAHMNVRLPAWIKIIYHTSITHYKSTEILDSASLSLSLSLVKKSGVMGSDMR